MIAMPFHDVLAIVGTSFVCALIVGAFGLAALWLARDTKLVVRLLIMVATSTLAVAAGTIAISLGMYISEHDLTVQLVVTATSIVAALLVTVAIARIHKLEHHRLAEVAESLRRGERVEDPPEPTHSELSELANDLARVSRELDDARAETAAIDASRRELVAWISHDLRTPLAGVRAMAEALEDGMADDPQRFHRQMKGQVDHISGLVDDLFALSKIHSGTLSLAKQEIALDDLISDVVADLRPIAQPRNITLRMQHKAHMMVLADPRELTRVIDNLLVNAIEHSPQNSIVTIETTKSASGEALLAVIDEAGGIAPEHVERVFETGWRATSSRSPRSSIGSSAGGGLGLAIVRGIVEAHDGAVSVANIPGGCRFEVRLPA